MYSLASLQFVLLAGLAAITLLPWPLAAFAAPPDYAVKDVVAMPTKWEKLGPASDDTVVHLHLGLKQRGYDELERRLYEVSDPASRRYGRHLTKDEVEHLVRPSQQTSELVEAWLASHGIQNLEYSPARDGIRVSLPVRAAEKLLGCEYHHFAHVDDGHVLLRSLSWSIPRHLHEHIDTIQPTTSFLRTLPQGRYDPYGGVPPPKWDTEGSVPTFDELVDEDKLERGHLDVPELEDMPPNPRPNDACNRLAISPMCLRVLYGLFDYVPQATSTNRIGIVNFSGNVNNHSDINMFLERYRPDAAKAGAAYNIETVLLAGGDNQQTPNTEYQMQHKKGLEGAVDAETLIGISHPTPLLAWNVGGHAPMLPSSGPVQPTANEPFWEWLQYLLAQPTLPHVISVSYADEEQTVPLSYAKRVCAAFAQLGARGVSVVVAAGDEGVGVESACGSGANKTDFIPVFPASCPFVTAVGATRHWDPVMTAFDGRSGFFTGGGFSNFFDRPAYQDAQVKPYVQSMGSKYKGRYNPKGRGIPDISVQGYHYAVIWSGVAHLMDGTSVSTPAFAAIVALLNDALLANGRPPLGFLNPWLYSQAGSAGIRDVKVGSNRGCGTMGFEAVEGWDAATGLGTPWFPALKAAAVGRKFTWQRPWYILQ